MQQISMIRCIYVLTFVLLSVSCQEEMEDIKELQVHDIINHNILEKFGVKVKKPPKKFFDPELKPFVSEFLADAKKHGVIVSEEQTEKLRQVKFVKELSSTSEHGVIAACSRYFMEEKSIAGARKKIKWMIIEVLEGDTDNFTKGNRIRLRELMYHELFHCLMNKGHLPVGIKGIMSPTFAEDDLRAFKSWEGLVADMFSKDFISQIPDTN